MDLKASLEEISSRIVHHEETFLEAISYLGLTADEETYNLICKELAFTSRTTLTNFYGWVFNQHRWKMLDTIDKTIERLNNA